MSKLVFFSLALCFSSFAQAACEPSRESISLDLKSAPAEEMTISRGFVQQNCLNITDFIARNTASRATPAARPSTPYSGGNRFNMTQNGKKMTADDFDAWMRANGIRVAGGKAQEPEPVVACTPTKKKPCPK